MYVMSITQVELNWLEDNFFFIRTWVLEISQADDGDPNTARPQMPIPGLNAIPVDIEHFLLRYYPVIRDWITSLETREIAADKPAIPFEDFLGRYDGRSK